MNVLQSSLTKRARNVDLPLASLAAITEIRTQLRALEERAVMNARDGGATWEEIAAALGITRQALQQRLARGTEKADLPPVP